MGKAEKAFLFFFSYDKMIIGSDEKTGVKLSLRFLLCVHGSALFCACAAGSGYGMIILRKELGLYIH